MTIGQRIQQARKNAKLSQKELGLRLGVSGTMIGLYENGSRNPKYETLQRIAEALGTDADWLRTGEVSEQQTQDGISEKPTGELSDEVFRFLSFFDLPPREANLFQKSCEGLKSCINALCEEVENGKKPEAIVGYAQGISSLVQLMKDLNPGGYYDIQKRYFKCRRQLLKYEEFLTKYKQLSRKGQKEAERYIDYLILSEEK